MQQVCSTAEFEAGSMTFNHPRHGRVTIERKEGHWEVVSLQRGWGVAEEAFLGKGSATVKASGTSAVVRSGDPEPDPDPLEE